MAVKLGTVEFYQAMADELNNDPEWKEKGKNLSYTMVYKYEAPIEGEFFTVFDQGKVTEVRHAEPQDVEKADFVISGSSDVWRGCFDGSINPTVAMTRGQLRVRGKMSQLLKNMSAFQHVITAMSRIDFE
ncbi:SCP2 sterol-binding domain-containing protein [Nocardioides zeae]|uniref:SCP2 sterol-binding domain-containing protein n=1 Tax=Nocardioides zeae TaxID=1457234 RepID=A0A6P0HGW3_9ACTN|nr:SCP2 sterol-binding domain-containing protein [Nocardioides zeae]NEN77878.1 SCP2 sterol-binding domain-containing protein [Nocardioides zeae]